MKSLAELRRDAGYNTQIALSKVTGFRQNDICRWESGDRKPPVRNIPDLARILNVTEGEIIAAITESKQSTA